MILKLPIELYDTALSIDFSEMASPPALTKQEDGFILEVGKADFREMQLIMNEDIVARGLERQDTVNELGKKLYRLYDELSYQRENADKTSF